MTSGRTDICKSCEIAGYLTEEAAMSWYSETDRVAVLTGARMWHEKCKGCGCGCAERKLLFRVWPFRRAELLVVQAVPGELDCPCCNSAELAPYGSKWRCPECLMIIPCCETEGPCETSCC
jgi:hypothetical protein